MADASPSVCALCLQPRELRISHFMPAALYPKNKKWFFAVPGQQFVGPEQIAAPLLCDECETLFNRNGENEALRWLAPKAKQGASPLYIAIRDGIPAWTEHDYACYWGTSIGLAPERFAYFGLNILWRAAAAEWPMPNGRRSTRLELGDFYEPVRLYLHGDAPFPKHVHVMVTVCSDEKSQQLWAPPQRSTEFDGLFVAPIIGALFRFWLGRVLPPPIHRTVFFPADGNPIFVTHCWDDTLRMTFSHLFDTELPDEHV